MSAIARGWVAGITEFTLAERSCACTSEVAPVWSYSPGQRASDMVVSSFFRVLKQWLIFRL